jgi:ABC-2 type transport system permease protein
VSGRRVVALFRRLTQEIRRDRPSLAILFVAPLLITGLVTFIVREGQAPTVDAAVVNDAGPAGVALTGALNNALATNGGSASIVPDEATARQQVADRVATVAILLPADLVTAPSPTITILTNGLDPPGEAAQLAAASRALLGMTAQATGASPPTIDHQTVYGTPNDDPISGYAPALLAFFAYFFVYILTGVSFLRERTGGTLERLMATPVTRGEIVIGYTLGFGLFAVIQVALLTAWVFGSLTVPAIGPVPSFAIGLGIPIAGSPLLAFLVVIVLALGAVSLGIFLSTFARTELQVIQFIPLVLVPQFLLSGVLFPLASLPAVLQPFSLIMPLTYAVNGLRQVLIRGADLSVGALQVDLLVLVAFAVAFATLAAVTIRRDIA